MTGCWAKTTPAVAVIEGWVWTTSFAGIGAMTLIAELVLGALLPSVRSVAVTVCEPVVPNVTLKLFFVPPTRVALAGKAAPVSLEVIPTLSVIVFTRFQLASTALTVTLKALLTDCVEGVPVLPVAVPGAAVSPGTRICSLTNAPAFTVREGVVLLGIVPWVTSDAVTVELPAFFRVTLRLIVPVTNEESDANAALLSLEPRWTVSLVLITFQFASTALTVTLKAVPAV